MDFTGTKYPISAFALILIAGVTFIFLQVGNVSVSADLPQKIYLVSISTHELGTEVSRILNPSGSEISTNSSIYGDPNLPKNQRTPGDGLRTFYTWGLWNRCAGYRSPSELQYCTQARIAHPFSPTASLMEDIPSAYSPTAKVLLEDQTHGLTPDTTTERLTRLAGFGWIFCLLNIAILLWLSVLLVMERGPEKLSTISLGISILNAIVAFIVSILWTVTILNLSRKIDHKSLATTTSSHIQIKVNFGPGSWLSWIVTCLSLMTVIPLLKIYVADRHAIAEEREVDRLVEAVLHPKEKELD